MNHKYAHILSPVQIGNEILRNRMIHPDASPHFLQGPEIFPAESFIAHYASVARAGAGLVTIAEWDNYPAQRSSKDGMADFTHMQAFDLSNEAVYNYMSALAEEVHFYGAKLIVHVEPEDDMPEGYSLHGGEDHGGLGLNRSFKKPAPKEMIHELIEKQVKKLKRYQSWGYDGLSIRLSRYMSNEPSLREDEYYCGSVEDRTRFIREMMEAVRRALGPDFIIEGTLHWQQPLGYNSGTLLGEGYDLTESLELIPMLHGIVDILTLRETDAARAHPLSYNFKKGEHGTVDVAPDFRALCGNDILLALNGGFQDPDEIEQLIASGTCDMISMARTFIAEPEYEKKLREDRPEDITPCIWCNLCHGNLKAPWISVCSVSPRLGFEHKLSRMIQPPQMQKKVAIIGGGPAGMRAAIYAAQRGHQVTLYEKTDYLGGQLLHAESFSFKWGVKDYRDWLVAQLKEWEIDVRLKTEPSPEKLEMEEYDAVIAATGAQPVLPSSIQGLRDESGNALYPTCHDVFGRESDLGKNVVIVGGSEVGVETAMYLAENGHNVTVLTRQKELAADASHLHYITMAYLTVGPDGKSRFAAAWEKYDNLKGILNVTTTSVRDNVVTYQDENGEEFTILADNVVICGGSVPRVAEALRYAKCAVDFYVIGDCNGAGNLWKCNHDAFSKANLI